MNKYFAYIRPKQGASQHHQRRLIERYAKRHQLEIIEWFEETGRSTHKPRPIFRRMLKDLAADNASGVISDTRERFSRNLVESAEIAKLANRGVEFHFVADRLDQARASDTLIRARRDWQRNVEVQAHISVLFLKMVNGFQEPSAKSGRSTRLTRFRRLL